MSRRWRVLIVSFPVMAWLITQGCDPTVPGADPMRNFWSDPPVIYTFLHNATTGHQTAVRIAFPSYTKTFNVTNPTGFTFLAQGFHGIGQLLLRRPFKPDGGGAFPPDPDEFQFDPWDFPDPEDDFPLPDPPDLPFPPDDPFDGFPDPPIDLPPFPDDEINNSNINTGSVNTSTTGGTPMGYTQPAPTGSAVKAPKSISVAGSVQVGPSPAGIVISPDHTTIYVAVQGNGSIAVIDRKSRTLTKRITLPAGAQPYALAITPDGTRLYAGDFVIATASVYSIDLPSGTVKTLSTPGSIITQAVVTPDGTQLWVCNFFGTVYIYDVLTNAYITQINIQYPWNLAFNANGTRAYIANGNVNLTGSVAVVDTASLQTIATIPVGTTPRNIRVTPSGRHVFVTNRDSNFISQIDTITNTVIRSIPIGDIGAQGIVFAHQ